MVRPPVLQSLSLPAPALDLKFSEWKSLRGQATLTRSSTGAFVGSNGLLQSAGPRLREALMS